MADDPRKITAMTMKPLDDKKLGIMRANMAIEWALTGAAEYTETIRTEGAEIQGVPRTLTYIEWEETDAA
jgi:hypothetical protein